MLLIMPSARRAERAEETRRDLMQAARALFAERGYAAVGTEEIASAARMTRGALYHHFRGGKRDVFRAVLEEMEGELTQTVAESALAAPDAWQALLEGCSAFLDACADPQLMRIVTVEAPGVLGWGEWREIDTSYGLGLMEAALQRARDAGLLRPAPVKTLAHVLLAALAEAALVMANADDVIAARNEAEQVLLALLDGLRADPANDNGEADE